MLAVCIATTLATASGWAAALHSNQKLAKLEAEDQADRAHPHAHGQRINWTMVDQRDADRRTKVLALLSGGQIRTADDFLNAAVIFQHGPSAEDTKLALAFAIVAARLDELEHRSDRTAVQMMANAWDRTLMDDKQPQWYGTQYVRSSENGPWRLYEVNSAVISDAQRKNMGLPTLAQAEAAVAALNAHQPKPH